MQHGIKLIETKDEICEKLIGQLIDEPDLCPLAKEFITPSEVGARHEEALRVFLNLDGADKDKVREFEIQFGNIPKEYIDNNLQKFLAEETSGPKYLQRLIRELKDVNTKIHLTEILNDKIKNIDNTLSADYVIEEIFEELKPIIKKSSNYIKPFNQLLPEIMKEIEEEYNGKHENVFNTKHFPSFNSATGGLRESNLVGIAGAWKDGKTTFATNLLLDFANQGIPCGLFSLEGSKAEIQRKILGALSNTPYEKLRTVKKLLPDELADLIRYYHSATKNNLPLFIAHEKRSDKEIKLAAKKIVNQNNVKIIMIDYLGLINSSNSSDSRERQLSRLSAEFKKLASELNVVIILVAQLNRIGKDNATSVNLAESIGLARDCDFLFTIQNTGNVSQLKKIYNGINDFLVKLDTSRHTKSGDSFILKLTEDGNLKEVTSQYDNSYQKSA